MLYAPGCASAIFAFGRVKVCVCVCVCMHTGARTHARALGARARVCAPHCACDADAMHTRAHVWVVWPTIELGYQSESMHMHTSIDIEL